MEREGKKFEDAEIRRIVAIPDSKISKLKFRLPSTERVFGSGYRKR